jgi:farnesyl diphosphate synthase
MAVINVSDAQSLTEAIARVAGAVEETLEAILPTIDGEGPEATLFEAMRYATLGGGKRLRPFLVVATAALFDVPESVSLRVGAAVELIHSYSLIHDDLPCMDDDPVRRGKPSCHVKFGESTAVLAGDAMVPLAFEVLSDTKTHPDASVRGELVARLAHAAGSGGMVGGQMIDLAAEKLDLDIGEVTRLERLKTGALIEFCCEAGGILGRADAKALRTLGAFAHDLGLAFQITDDLLDVEGEAQRLGKAVGKDAARGKATFVTILGPTKARDQARLLAEQAARHLEIFGADARLLCEVTRYVVARTQ